MCRVARHFIRTFQRHYLTFPPRRMRLRMIYISFEQDCRRGILARYAAYCLPSLLNPSLCVYKIRRYDAKLECIIRESIFVKDKTFLLQKPQCRFYLPGTNSQKRRLHSWFGNLTFLTPSAGLFPHKAISLYKLLSATLRRLLMSNSSPSCEHAAQ